MSDPGAGRGLGLSGSFSFSGLEEVFGVLFVPETGNDVFEPEALAFADWDDERRQVLNSQPVGYLSDMIEPNWGFSGELPSLIQNHIGEVFDGVDVATFN